MFRFQSADATHTWRLRTESGEPHCRFFHVFTLNASFFMPISAEFRSY